MLSLSVGLADAEAKRELVVELGMSKVQIAAGVQSVHEQLIGPVPGTQAEADQIELRGRGEFKA